MDRSLRGDSKQSCGLEANRREHFKNMEVTKINEEKKKKTWK